MKSILVINSGSTSLKYKVLDFEQNILQEGSVSGVGSQIKDHHAAFEIMAKDLGDLSNIAAVGHRIVHGGNKFLEPILVNEDLLSQLEDLSLLAPLHNPPGIAGIKASWQIFGQDSPNVAVFDTSFYRDLPKVATLYALPTEILSQEHIRRYGFHGISHESVARQAYINLGKDPDHTNLITIHLGGGSSMTAIKNGKPVDTSMGFTPVEGLVMMTRSGDIDAGIPIFLQKEMGYTVDQINKVLNQDSGVCALSGIKTGMIDIEKAAQAGDERANLALDFYVYKIKKYIGSYLAILGRVDALVFTGAIGYGSDFVRNKVLAEFELLSNIPVMPIKSQEEKLIAEAALNLIKLNGEI